jgi:hypothetical protein
MDWLIRVRLRGMRGSEATMRALRHHGPGERTAARCPYGLDSLGLVAWHAGFETGRRELRRITGEPGRVDVAGVKHRHTTTELGGLA